MISLTEPPKFGRLLPLEDGWLTCPRCKKTTRLKRIFQVEEAERVGVYCRKCKRYVFVSIHQGQCFDSQCQ